MFYLIEVEYVGQYAARRTRYEIRTEQGRGLVGTIDNWFEFARGEFDNVSDALIEIEKRCGDDGYRIEEGDDDPDSPIWPINVYPGRYLPMGRIESQDRCYASMRGAIKAHFTDADIEDWFDECKSCAKDEGYTLDRDAVIEMATEYRDELNEE